MAPVEHGGAAPAAGETALSAIADVLPADAGKDPQTAGLYRLVFWILGLALGVLVIGWIVLIGIGKTVPAELPVVIGTIIGGLVGVIAPGSTAARGSGS